MKNIIITGAGGLVATELIIKLLKETEWSLFLLSTHKEKIVERYKKESRVKCFTLEEFGEWAKDRDVVFDVCMHTAFARSGDGSALVGSITYQRELIRLLTEIKVKFFVNISSQSVYGKRTQPLWKEDSVLDPDYLYAFGKYTSEVVTELMLWGGVVKYMNIRLCSVCENARFVRIFVQNAIDGKSIHLTAPDQHCSFIDVRDVASALHLLIDKADSLDWNRTYNLGANIVNSIEEIAYKVKCIGEEEYDLKDVVITSQESDNHIRIGMDSTALMEVLNWRPLYSMDDMIRSMFEMLKNSWGGGCLSTKF